MHGWHFPPYAHTGSLLKRRPSVILVLTCPLGMGQETALEWGLLCWRQRWPSLRLSASSGLCWLQRQRWGSVSYIWCAHTVHDMHVFSWYFCDNSYGMVCCTAGSFGSCDRCHFEAQARGVCQVWTSRPGLISQVLCATHFSSFIWHTVSNL